MIKIENVVEFGWEPAIRGMRNPMNSWDLSDSVDVYYDRFEVGDSDKHLAMRLAKAGTEHSKYRRMISVYADITAPLYWWKEFDTYKVGTVANSCSTMHKIQAKEFTLDNFSIEHLNKFNTNLFEAYIIPNLNEHRLLFCENEDKDDWWQMIQLLPSSYNQLRTVMLNYEVLAAMYHQRKNHKLDEWHTFCDWIKELPYSEIITLEEN